MNRTSITGWHIYSQGSQSRMWFLAKVSAVNRHKQQFLCVPLALLRHRVTTIDHARSLIIHIGPPPPVAEILRPPLTRAEAQKRVKYSLLSRSHHFVPVAIKASGALEPDALSSLIFASVSRQLHVTTSPSHSFFRVQPGGLCCLCFGHLKIFLVIDVLFIILI